MNRRHRAGALLVVSMLALALLRIGRRFGASTGAIRVRAALTGDERRNGHAGRLDHGRRTPHRSRRQPTIRHLQRR